MKVQVGELRPREADDDFMPSHEEDGSPLDDGDSDHDDDDGKKGIVARKRAQPPGRWTIPFDERFKALMDFKHKFSYCNVKSGEHQSLGNWYNNLRTSYKKIQKRERPPHPKSQRSIYGNSRMQVSSGACLRLAIIF